MKRLIACAVLLLVGVVVVSMLQASDRSLVTDPATLLNGHRQRLLERLKEKVESMDDEQVQKALEIIDAEIDEIEAAQRLKQAAAILQSIVDDYPNAPSGTRAAQMLRANTDQPFCEPGPMPYGAM